MRGIILRPWEVQGLLAGRLSALCRVVKPQPEPGVVEFITESCATGWHGYYIDPEDPDDVCYSGDTWHSPFGVPGDTFFVKETHRFMVHPELWDVVEYRVDEAIRKPTGLDRNTGFTFSMACDLNDERWKPAGHMKEWASRMSITTVSTRVLRVQEATEDDCISAGIWMMKDGPLFAHVSHGLATHNFETPIEALAYVHDKHNPKAKWESNPWCWYAEIERKNDG